MTGSKRTRPSRGFTLMEVILAVAIISFIMMAIYGTLFTTIEARDEIEMESLKARIGPAILDLIERDITGVWCMNIHDNDVFFGEERSINGEPADVFHMITSTNSTVVEMNEDEAVRSDLTEVSYLLRQSPSAPELLELYRRQDFHVDDRIAEGGIYELVYSRIIALQVRYYSDIYEGADQFEEWDSKLRNRLPAAMEIILTLEIDPRLAGYDLHDRTDRSRQEFRQIIFFPQGSELTMAVRPVIPAFVEPGEDPGGDAGGGGGRGGGGPPGDDDGKGGLPGDGKGGDGGHDFPDLGDGFKPGDDFPKIPDPGGDLPGGDVNIDDLWKLLKGFQ